MRMSAGAQQPIGGSKPIRRESVGRMKPVASGIATAAASAVSAVQVSSGPAGVAQMNRNPAAAAQAERPTRAW
jgi:hypothetical protein